jgi:hypothetical protein
MNLVEFGVSQGVSFLICEAILEQLRLVAGVMTSLLTVQPFVHSHEGIETDSLAAFTCMYLLDPTWSKAGIYKIQHARQQKAILARSRD